MPTGAHREPQCVDHRERGEQKPREGTHAVARSSSDGSPALGPDVRASAASTKRIKMIL